MKTVKKILRFVFILAIIAGWLFSSWPKIWQNPPVPPEIQKALAAAAPVIENYTEQWNTTGNTTLTFSKPSGVQVGELLLIIAVNDDTSATAFTDNKSGWNFIADFGNGTSDSHVGLFWRIADGTEGGTEQVTSAGSDEWGGWYVRISGVDTNEANTINAVGTQTTLRGSSVTATAVTTDVDDCLALCFGSFDGGDGNNSAPFSVSGTGWSYEDDGSSGTTGYSDTSGVWGKKSMTGTQGSTGDATISSDGTSDGMVGAQIAIAPAVNDPPSLTVSQPDGVDDTVTVGDNYNITYDLSDSEDEAAVDFYYDSNDSGLDGTAITGCQDQAEGTGATCSWDTTGMSAGDYYVYGIATDGMNDPVDDYSPGQITIQAAPAGSLTLSNLTNIQWGDAASGTTKNGTINCTITTTGTTYDVKVAKDQDLTSGINTIPSASFTYTSSYNSGIPNSGVTYQTSSTQFATTPGTNVASVSSGTAADNLNINVNYTLVIPPTQTAASSYTATHTYTLAVQ